MLCLCYVMFLLSFCFCHVNVSVMFRLCFYYVSVMLLLLFFATMIAARKLYFRRSNCQKANVCIKLSCHFFVTFPGSASNIHICIMFGRGSTCQ